MTVAIFNYPEMYAAQLSVFGEEGQRRLRRARVHVAGTGGIGSQVLQNLAAAGVGHLTANDPQVLSVDNLNRFPTANAEDIGRLKIDILAHNLRGRPFPTFEGIAAENQHGSVLPFFKAGDLIVCASNTVQGQLAAAANAITYKKPLFDIGVSDARVKLSGNIRIWLPSEARWSACPACYFQQFTERRTGEALFFPVLALTAAIATVLLTHYIARLPLPFGTDGKRNLFLFDLAATQLTAMAVRKRTDCRVCGRCSPTCL